MVSVIIHKFNLSGTEFSPSEDDSPLVIDSDGVKPKEIASQNFWAVTRRHCQVAENASLVHLDHFS